MFEDYVHLAWEEFLKLIKDEVGSQVVETWFKAVTLESWDQTHRVATLLCPNQFVSRWISEHYVSLMQKHLGRLFNVQQLTIKITHGATVQAKRTIIPASIAHTQQSASSSEKSSSSEKIEQRTQAVLHCPETVTSERTTTSNQLIPRAQAAVTRAKQKNAYQLKSNYTFESFVVGTSNSLAYAAARAICENPGELYNPLFIYGGTGLGKTHLLHAIGNEIKKQHPSLVVHYETSDHFVNDFISSIRFDKIQQFRNKYRSIDLFLIDDVQFFSNKDQTQEIFFHIFNMLHEQKKQIVLSSDTFPKEIHGLQNRLKSRLEWGLIADIQIPDLETKIAILGKKAESLGLTLNSSVAEFIASRIISNIRELEGALVRVSAFATLTNQPITLEMARKVLVTLNEKRQDDVQLETILKLVAKHYGTTTQEIRSKKRHQEIAQIRQIALYLMKKLTLNSLQVIGKYIGGRDHSTVIHAIAKVEQQLKNDYNFVQKIKLIEQEIAML